MAQLYHYVVSLAIFVFQFCQDVNGHGRLLDPPSRSSMWRFRNEFPNAPINYNDNQLFCGGRQHLINMGGRCGICGDAYDRPRENEAGGRYATGKISRHFTSGQVITINVEVTANHLGYFEFKLCPNNNPSKPATQECLDRYPLQVVGQSGTRVYIGRQRGQVKTRVRLPAGVTCSQCVLQWYYKTGNSYGRDPNGKFCMGCGIQESFFGCADIAISGSGGAQSPVHIQPVTATPRPTRPPYYVRPNQGSGAIIPNLRPVTATPNVQTTQPPIMGRPNGRPLGVVIPGIGGMQSGGFDYSRCHGINNWQGVMDNWCKTNCAAGNCPTTACSCA